ncbi:hypothetical protein cyc_03278 [Cyclospora cayetanensis]|uniref:Uncharacterized protein n=1 Tax=Cyclospora cayetanensis TaxID=88456 RepID=A0A1D3CQX7_9EIME|nr:hypothetical protein cyc_03278 [Cyclospora cayetanensis]
MQAIAKIRSAAGCVPLSANVRPVVLMCLWKSIALFPLTPPSSLYPSSLNLHLLSLQMRVFLFKNTSLLWLPFYFLYLSSPVRTAPPESSPAVDASSSTEKLDLLGGRVIPVSTSDQLIRPQPALQLIQEEVHITADLQPGLVRLSRQASNSDNGLGNLDFDPNYPAIAYSRKQSAASPTFSLLDFFESDWGEPYSIEEDEESESSFFSPWLGPPSTGVSNSLRGLIRRGGMY